MSDNVTALPVGGENSEVQDANNPAKVQQLSPEQQQQYMVYCARLVEMMRLMGSQDLRSADAALRATDQAMQAAGQRIQELEAQVANLTAGEPSNDS